MPELPEVETITRRLRDGTTESPPLVGQVIRDVNVYWDRIIQQPTPVEFTRHLKDKIILGVGRRGKFLHFPLDEGHLIGHLRMSGDMRVEPKHDPAGLSIPRGAYDQVVFNLESDWRLVFSSIRKFSRMWVVDDVGSVFGELGPEPLSAEFTPKILYQMLQHHSRQIKPLLMDQRFLAGMGNIYTDEALFLAKIHPLRRADTLSQSEATDLFRATQFVLKKGIQEFGSSLDWMYRGGNFQNHFQVQQREGEPCPTCGTTIVKFKVGQRGTYICPKCQPHTD